MTAKSRPSRRRLAAGVAPVVLVLAALPLLAPTCGDSGEGYKTFSRGSMIIPMDLCYQYQADGVRDRVYPDTSSLGSYTPTGCTTVDQGNVIKAYGLVYQLVRNDIPVYWIIDPSKSTPVGVDMTIQYDGGAPVVFYDWTPSDPPPAAVPTSSHVINYRGGPFVVDASDYARASQVLQSFGTMYSGVNVHLSNVAFRAYAKRTMAGGWGAGGTVAPKVALLDIGSTSGSYAKNSEPIIRGYLAQAGLDFIGAGGSASDSGHGVIYDRLGMTDLQPSTPGDWTTTNLAKYGYQILWVPHWFAPGSCSNTSGAPYNPLTQKSSYDTQVQSNCNASQYPDAQVDAALRTIGAFVASGKDLFAECAGLGSFEGVPGNASYANGIDPDTHFQEETGLSINGTLTSNPQLSNFASPLMQLGDWLFFPKGGAIQNYKPVTTPYRQGVQRLVTDANAYDYFTLLPGVSGAPSGNHGTVVYLGGHAYSGYEDFTQTNGALVYPANNYPFQIGATRLVLNTLFNLGATCTASGIDCNTGQPGICATGKLVCQNGQPVCSPTKTPTAEICNGLDDDCDSEVDEGLEQVCYDGPVGTADEGVCRSGVRSCVRNASGTYGMTACIGEVLPSPETCNALDDDCNGTADEGLSQSCYEGPPTSIDPTSGQPRPACQPGTRTCNAGSWSACIGQVLPQPEVCTGEGFPAVDEDCDGVLDNGCSCINGTTRDCYAGPAGTAGVGICKMGKQTCAGNAWGLCTVCPNNDPSDPANADCQILPSPEVCGNPVDENCDTLVPACPECTSGQTRSCYPGSATDTLDSPSLRTQCVPGSQSCVAQVWGECVGATLPSSFEACDAIDNDCDGTVDESATCPKDQTCLNGVCVPSSCGGEVQPPPGYDCQAGKVVQSTCGSQTCAPGEVCSQYGSCLSPCDPNPCASGSVCGGGACVAGGCYDSGCTDPATPLCLDGTCKADPCAGANCPSGTFCRQGDCVQACAFVSCAGGEKCGIDGFCVADPCSGTSCGPGQRCDGGSCVDNHCEGKRCATGQVCQSSSTAAVCVDDPCNGITCPTGTCVGGQCYSTRNPNGQGTVAPPPEEKAAGGCGCGSGSGAALPALLALLAAPLTRRRRTPRRGGALALLVVAAGLAGSACRKPETPFDPSTCSETCAEQRCVDLQADPVHCGTCTKVCGAGEACADAVCGASSAAPFVRSVSPASAPRGTAAATVDLYGERFRAGAVVRVLTAQAPVPSSTTFVDAGHLAATLDLSAASAGPLQLRVVNPDNVISNAYPFDVVAPNPTLTKIEPAIVTAGDPTAFVVASGTGFTSTSQCHLKSASIAETALQSVLADGGLRCTIGDKPPGSYQIWVVNEGNFLSETKTLTVVSATATLAAVNPSSGPENATVTLTLTGTGFDVDSRALFDGVSTNVGTTYVNATTLLAALALPACGQTSCAHTVSVRQGTGATTGTLDFTVRKDFPFVSSFAPATGYQGETVTLTFTGTGFPAGTTIEVQPPGGAFGTVTVTTGAVSCTGGGCTVSGTLDLAGEPEGSWLARLQYPGIGTSEASPFRVLSNQAILYAYACTPLPERSGPQGTTKSATLQVANLRPPYADVRVVFRCTGQPDRLLTPSPVPSSPTSPLTVSLDLRGLPTGTCPLAVRNPNGATDSNTLSFNVTPGLPTLTSLSPTSHAQSATTTTVTVTLTGTNFAAPDSSGNGGSIVHVTMIVGSEVWVPDTAIPSARTTVVSPTSMQILLDVLDGIPGAYDVTVWNPPLATDANRVPQKSNTLVDAFTIDP